MFSPWSCDTTNGFRSFVAPEGVDAYVCTGEASPAGWHDLMLHFRSCGTWEGFSVCALLSEWTASTCWLVFQPWSVVASHLLLQTFSMPLIIVSAPKRCPDLSSHPFLYFNISFCRRTSAFYDWSNILFILSDLYPFRYLVITLPCLKKKRAY